MGATVDLHDDGTVDEFDDYQYEVSNELANEFIDEELIPLLEEFDQNNENSEYVPGMAVFCLFAKLCIHLMNEGYGVDELKKMVEDFSEFCVDDTIH